MAAAFERILGAAGWGRPDSFLDLGGDSLIAARLTGWIRQRYGVPMAVRELFSTPTVAALAERIAVRAPTETEVSSNPQEG